MTEVKKKKKKNALVRLKKKDLRTVSSMNRSVYYPFNPNKLSPYPPCCYSVACAQ